MKIGISVDDVKFTQYVVGRYDFYTRQMDVDPGLATALQKVEDIYLLSQRILSSLYNSNGRFVNPEDLEKFKCLSGSANVEQAMPAVVSAKPRKKQGTEVPSSSESQTI